MFRMGKIIIRAGRTKLEVYTMHCIAKNLNDIMEMPLAIDPTLTIVETIIL